MSDAPGLLSPVLLGPYLLRNRVVMPPLTRNRADAHFVPTPRMAVYYAQRASAGLQVAEGTAISGQAVAYPRVPGIWSSAQVAAWRRVTDAVHAAGGVIFQQLWHVGRVSHSLTQPSGDVPVAPSAVRIDGATIMTADGPKEFETPRALETDEVEAIVQDYARAARNAMRAGFDGVEIHAANGYLIDQFLNDQVNRRTDRYGGELSHRLRFLLEVVDAVAGVWGTDRVGVRLSPSGTFMQCRDTDRKGLYTAAVRALDTRALAYLHLVEPTIAGSMSVEASPDAIPSAYFREVYTGTLIVSGDHTFETGTEAIGNGQADLIGYGRAFISNPDLPYRFAQALPLAPAERRTFYTDGDKGYVDYPSSAEAEHLAAVQEALERGQLSPEAVRRALADVDPLFQVASGQLHAGRELIGESS
jgi:NADH:flavin oxidoreductases, Old Yellow Enzyme family